MSVLDAVGSIARFCVKSVEEGFSEKADIIKDCQAEAKWYGNEELFRRLSGSHPEVQQYMQGKR